MHQAIRPINQFKKDDKGAIVVRITCLLYVVVVVVGVIGVIVEQKSEEGVNCNYLYEIKRVLESRHCCVLL
jgi:hypothetical protein